MKPIQIRNTDFKSIFCAKNRRDSEPEVCPFRGPFTFSYAKGGSGALCSFPRSYLDSCQDPTKLQLSFQVKKDLFCRASCSVEDPDPDPSDPFVFGTPGSGSGSISQRYGSGSRSFYHQVKIGKKNLDSYCFATSF
jgi:hypothetical protein